jgi:hypothetical protein
LASLFLKLLKAEPFTCKPPAIQSSFLINLRELGEGNSCGMTTKSINGEQERHEDKGSESHELGACTPGA